MCVTNFEGEKCNKDIFKVDTKHWNIQTTEHNSLKHFRHFTYNVSQVFIHPLFPNIKLT